jgi:hypothetical protein
VLKIGLFYRGPRQVAVISELPRSSVDSLNLGNVFYGNQLCDHRLGRDARYPPAKASSRLKADRLADEQLASREGWFGGRQRFSAILCNNRASKIFFLFTSGVFEPPFSVLFSMSSPSPFVCFFPADLYTIFGMVSEELTVFLVAIPYRIRSVCPLRVAQCCLRMERLPMR